ncbi:MAG: 4Fe-4S dicluster domain-containing protein [Balneolaceae bacterium]|nr:4Fe-4S dicluster domain-containing protein [Balneolaceae bacterium]
MALQITDACINCGYCIAECPNQAIYEPGMKWSLGEGTQLKGDVKIGRNRMLNADQLYPPLSNDYHYIVPEKCSECMGVFDEPQCNKVCPDPLSFRKFLNNEKLIDLIQKQSILNLNLI